MIINSLRMAHATFIKEERINSLYTGDSVVKINYLRHEAQQTAF